MKNNLRKKIVGYVMTGLLFSNIVLTAPIALAESTKSSEVTIESSQKEATQSTLSTTEKEKDNTLNQIVNPGNLLPGISKPHLTREVVLDANIADYPTIGDMPFLEVFGDVEGQGILENTELMEKNVPIEFPTDNKDSRNYYIFDGALDTREPNSEKINLDLNKPMPQLDDDPSKYFRMKGVPIETDIAGLRGMYPHILIKSETGKLTAYNFVYGSYNSTDTGYSIGTSEEYEDENFATLPEENKPVGSTGKYSFKQTYLTGRSYSDIKNARKISYIAIIENPAIENADGPYHVIGYFRVESKPVNSRGRVRTEFSYVNTSAQKNKNYSALAYGLHVDIQGYHQSSKLYSAGNSQGEYFYQPKIDDEKPYYLMFHRDGYKDQPVARAADNNYAFKIVGGKNTKFNYGEIPKDPGKDAQFRLDHPSLAYLWEKKLTPPGEIVKWGMEQSVTTTIAAQVITKYLEKGTDEEISQSDSTEYVEGDSYKTEPKDLTAEGYRLVDPKPENAEGIMGKDDIVVTYYYEKMPDTGNVISHFVDSDGKTILTDEILSGEIGENYEVKPKDIEGYVYIKSEGNLTGEITEEDQEVTFTYLSVEKAFSLKQTVVNNKGNSVDKGKVKQGETLTYQLDFSVDKVVQDLDYVYESVNLSEGIDNNLTDIRDIVLTDKSGKVVGDATYDEAGKQITGNLTSKDLNSKESLILTYQGTVKKDAPIGEMIRESGLVDSVIKLKELTAKVEGMASNEVESEIEAGLLEFVSAPTKIDFGQSKFISFKDETYQVENIEGDDLVVQDNRVPGEGWKMSVSLIKPLTSPTGDTLVDSLYYKGDTDDVLISNTAQIIHSKTTVDDKLINLSESWSSETGLRLKVKAGLAKATSYQGSIQWLLMDTP